MFSLFFCYTGYFLRFFFFSEWVRCLEHRIGLKKIVDFSFSKKRGKVKSITKWTGRKNEWSHFQVSAKILFSKKQKQEIFPEDNSVVRFVVTFHEFSLNLFIPPNSNPQFTHDIKDHLIKIKKKLFFSSSRDVNAFHDDSYPHVH